VHTSPACASIKGGYDWTQRFPWIAEAALKNRQQQFVIDGEAVVLGVDGISDFNALHSRKHDHDVQLYAFDILALGGDVISRTFRTGPICENASSKQRGRQWTLN
jgi:ATP-dependent DNA ligase